MVILLKEAVAFAIGIAVGGFGMFFYLNFLKKK